MALGSADPHLMRPLVRRAPLPMAVGLLAVAWACGGGSTPTAPSTPAPSTSPAAAGPAASLPSLDEMLADKVLGSAAAPVAIVEYSSLTCSHCASFHKDTMPQIRAAYIDGGRVKLIYRDYPLDQVALSAAMIARCSGERYFAVLDLLFASQTTWAGSTDPVGALKRTVASTGLAAADVDTCLANADLRSGILRIQATGQSQYGVRATPTFIVGGRLLEGAYPFATFDAILKGLLP